jgi:predicted P-loop ATPase/GTPase
MVFIYIIYICNIYMYNKQSRDRWVPVTTAWRVLLLRMEERPPIWRVAANILNKQSQTADKAWSSYLGGEVLTTPHR